jgi:hypothetical protein
VDLNKLFSGEVKSNVYLLSPTQDTSDLSTLTAENDYAFFVFDGRLIHDMDDFLDQFEQVMNPPEHGRNWNSFDEHFSFVSWVQARGVIVLYTDFQNFMTSTKHDYDKDDFNTLIDVLVNMPEVKARVSQRRQFHLRPFYVLLQGAYGDQLPLTHLE